MFPIVTYAVYNPIIIEIQVQILDKPLDLHVKM
jgi:hypothetical protein